MPTITVQCPHCNFAGRIPENARGLEIGCKQCGRKFAAIPVRDGGRAPKWEAEEDEAETSEEPAAGNSSRKTMIGVIVGLVILAVGAGIAFVVDRAKAVDRIPLRLQASLATHKGLEREFMTRCDYELKKNPTNDDALAARAILYSFRATTHGGDTKADDIGAAGDFDAAIRDNDAAIKIAPSNFSYWEDRADIYRDMQLENRKRRGRLAANPNELRVKEIQALDQMIVLQPTNWLPRVRRANHRLDDGDVTGALSDAEAVLAIEPDNTSALIIRATCRLSRGDTKGAEADFRKAILAGNDYAKRIAAEKMPSVFGR